MIVFRVDSSSVIGNGHVIRCLSLAKVLRKQGAKCKFLCRDFENNLIEKIKNNNFEITIFPNISEIRLGQSTKDLDSNYSNWLGADWDEDAKSSIDALNNEKIDWLIVDHYGIDRRWEKKLRQYTKKIMVIDDLANRNHDCDLLLDQNLVANFEKRYQNFLPDYCNTLLGPKYALLQNEYKDLHPSALPRIGPTKNILVYFGGTDLNNLTMMTLTAFLNLKREDVKLNVVISSNSPQKEKIEELSKKNENIKIYLDLTTLAPLMLKADMAIGACGTTSWERCCLGLYSIVITTAENQKPVAQELHKQGLIRWLGHFDTITNNIIFNELKNLIDQNLEVWSNACKLVTDGSGTNEVASIISFNS